MHGSSVFTPAYYIDISNSMVIMTSVLFTPNTVDIRYFHIFPPVIILSHQFYLSSVQSLNKSFHSSAWLRIPTDHDIPQGPNNPQYIPIITFNHPNISQYLHINI